jgi:hypothetical protein
VHDLLVREVGVRHHDEVDRLPAQEGVELLLGDDRDPLRVAGTGERGRVAAARDVRDLRRGERDDPVVGPAAVEHVEVVEVAARGPEDDDALLLDHPPAMADAL